MAAKIIRLGDALVERGKITNAQLSEALDIQKEMGLKLGEVLLLQNFISENDLLKTLEEVLNIPFIDITTIDIDPKLPKLITGKLAHTHNIIPVMMEKSKLVIATFDPLDVRAIDDVRIITGLEVSAVLSTRQSIEHTINKFYDAQEEVDKAIEEFSASNNFINVDTNVNVAEGDDVLNSPIVRLVSTIINQAVRRGVSDIHIEPFEDRVRVRYRIDGELIEAMTSTTSTHFAIVARIKIIGNMDISEKRKPQDGRLETVIYGKNIDMRLSIIPTVYGEKVVIRLLDRDSLVVSIDKLNLSNTNLARFHEILKVPEGMILVTGPTGSGKTTTLYSILSTINTINSNIITVEDPVEYRIDGINQVQVSDKAGLTFANSLRSILRQDPNVIMVGEIRDGETAEIATRASITGHVVLSTIHTNDTASTVSRLVDMGIETFLVSSALVGIVAQRLVKVVCPKCSTPYVSSAKEMEVLNIVEPVTLKKSVGCQSCNNTGYKGRTAIHEIMLIDQDIRSAINKNNTADEIKKISIEKGMQTLNDSCAELVVKGVTTIDEMLKVTYSFE